MGMWRGRAPGKVEVVRESQSSRQRRIPLASTSPAKSTVMSYRGLLSTRVRPSLGVGAPFPRLAHPHGGSRLVDLPALSPGRTSGTGLCGNWLTGGRPGVWLGAV